MIDDFEDIDAALSLGVGNDCLWDIDVAEKGIKTYQFDHTIEFPPARHPGVAFFPHKVVSVPEQEGETIGGLVERYGSGEDARLILKMDIEGDEWPILEHADPKHLRKFAQIVCEFHGFKKATDQEWYDRTCAVMAKLLNDFAVVHVHGNNAVAAPFVLIGNVPFPRLLEVTFANRGRYTFETSDEIFPTPLDQPNRRGRPDLFLGPFKF